MVSVQLLTTKAGGTHERRPRVLHLSDCQRISPCVRPSLQLPHLIHSSEPRTRRRSPGYPALLVIGFLMGCGASSSSELNDTARTENLPIDRSVATTLHVTPEQLRRRLNANEMASFLVSGNDIVEVSLFRSGVRSIEPLRGLPLRALDLGFTRVTDLSPLAGMMLESLVLENVAVDDISLVRGMPLKTLKLQNTQVTDFSVLKSLQLSQLNLLNLPFTDVSMLSHMPLDTVWLTGTGIQNLDGLPLKKLVSLDIERTQVKNIDVLKNAHSLRRLNIADTDITDITPLQNLKLERLVLSPEKITLGMDELRRISGLSLIQTSVEESMSAADFWKRFDLGVWKSPE